MESRSTDTNSSEVDLLVYCDFKKKEFCVRICGLEPTGYRQFSLHKIHGEIHYAHSYGLSMNYPTVFMQPYLKLHIRTAG